MKEFLEKNKVTYNLMSFTGFKSILLFAYLLDKPRSYEEVKDYFQNHEYLHEAISIDTLRVYINSLERLGCVITKSKKAEGSKYTLVRHPFELRLNDEQAKNIIKLYKNLLKSVNVEEMISLTKFFNKIAYSTDNPDLKDFFLNISPFKNIPPEIINTLIQACRKKEEIEITYNSPGSGEKNIDVLAEKLSLKNNRIYLYGTSQQYPNTAIFLVSRIVDTPRIKLSKQIRKISEPLVIGCEIYDKTISLLENERIISEDENKLVIEIDSDNQFFTRQRILSMGKYCKVLYPQSFKEDLCSILKKIKEEYIAEEI